MSSKKSSSAAASSSSSEPERKSIPRTSKSGKQGEALELDLLKEKYRGHITAAPVAAQPGKFTLAAHIKARYDHEREEIVKKYDRIKLHARRDAEKFEKKEASLKVKRETSAKENKKLSAIGLTATHDRLYPHSSDESAPSDSSKKRDPKPSEPKRAGVDKKLGISLADLDELNKQHPADYKALIKGGIGAIAAALGTDNFKIQQRGKIPSLSPPRAVAASSSAASSSTSKKRKTPPPSVLKPRHPPRKQLAQVGDKGKKKNSTRQTYTASDDDEEGEDEEGEDDDVDESEVNEGDKLSISVYNGVNLSNDQLARAIELAQAELKAILKARVAFPKGQERPFKRSEGERLANYCKRKVLQDAGEIDIEVGLEGTALKRSVPQQLKLNLALPGNKSERIKSDDASPLFTSFLF